MQRYRRCLAALLAGLACLTPLSTQASLAAGETGLPVVIHPSDINGNETSGPGYFELTATPGSTTKLYALVGNKSHQKAVVSIVPVDGGTGVYGGITAKLSSDPRRVVGSWIHLLVHRVKLDPYKAQVVSFTLHVPTHTAPGQYVGALTAMVPAHDVQRGRGFAFTVQTRLADDVVVTVPGPQTWQFQPKGVTAQKRTVGTYVIAHIKNSGSMMLRGWGYLWLWQQGRRNPVLAIPLHLDTTLPHTMTNYPLQLGKHPRPGRYAFELKVWWNGGKSVQHGSMRIR